MASPSVQPAKARNNAEYMAQFIMPARGFNMLRNIEEILKVLLFWASGTIVPFIRYEFGERYFTVTRVLMGYLFIRIALGFVTLRNMLSVIPGIGSLPYEVGINRWYVLSFTALSIWHLAMIRLRNHRGREWYSQSPGISWLEWVIPWSGYRITEGALYRFIEPGVCFFVAWFILPIFMQGGSFTRNWLMFASVGLFMFNNMNFNTRRNRMLDLMDGEIESRYFIQMREGKHGGAPRPKAETAGYTVMSIPQAMQERLSDDFSATVERVMRGSETGNQKPEAGLQG